MVTLVTSQLKSVSSCGKGPLNRMKIAHLFYMLWFYAHQGSSTYECERIFQSS